MKTHILIWLIAIIVIAADSIEADELKAKIMAINGDTVQLSVEGELLPAVGDPVEIFALIPGIDDEAAVAKGKVQEIRFSRTIIKITKKHSTISTKHQARIVSPKPQRRIKPQIKHDEFDGARAGEERMLAGMKFVWCPAGGFTMGSPLDEADRDDDEVQVEVFLTRGFWLAKYEMTQRDYARLMDSPWEAELSVLGSGLGPRYAASHISWDDAIAYSEKLTDQERRADRLPDGWEFTLPTEAQWEYACRAGTNTSYSFAAHHSQLSDYAWFEGNSFSAQFAHEIGLKKPNSWGLHDMYGNVREWCRDWHEVKLPGGIDPEATPRAPFAVARGGSYRSRSLHCRSAARFSWIVNDPDSAFGFRVALAPIGSGVPPSKRPHNDPSTYLIHDPDTGGF